MNNSSIDSNSIEESIECSPNTGKCRICWRTSYLSDLMSPCVCSGSLLYTHFECLERWIQERDSTERDVCDVCQQKYRQIIVKQSKRSFSDWLREGEDVSAKIFSTIILMSFFFYLLNMGCIQFVISEAKVNAIIRYIQLVLIIFFSFLFSIFFFVALYVFRCDFKEWQTSHMNTTVQRIDGSNGRQSTDSSLTSNQSNSSYNNSNGNCVDCEDQTKLIINDSIHTYGSV